MPDYIINRVKTDGKYNEVHKSDCGHRPGVENRESLGWHIDGIDAVRYAKSIGYYAADGCKFCSPEAHKG